ncbi:MAG: radical SAM protein, partial [Deltaproteobacteria bacterium]|nr:radical SAM protein [Deltaproteobacteria bacterium]
MAPRKKLHLTTFGCQMNVDDSQRLAWLLAGRGFEPATEAKSADLIVINTCSVRAKAEQKACSLLGRLKRLKAARPGLIIVLAGCLAQQEGRRLLKRFSHLDAVIGTGALARLPDLIARAKSGERMVDIGLDRELPGPLESAPEGVGVRSQVTIMAGCNNFCAYCVVPYLRGRERSRPPAEILAEVAAKVGAGAREINLLGQNVNSYHYGDWDFVRLLEAVSCIK